MEDSQLGDTGGACTKQKVNKRILLRQWITLQWKRTGPQQPRQVRLLLLRRSHGGRHLVFCVFRISSRRVTKNKESWNGTPKQEKTNTQQTAHTATHEKRRVFTRAREKANGFETAVQGRPSDFFLSVTARPTPKKNSRARSAWPSSDSGEPAGARKSHHSGEGPLAEFLFLETLISYQLPGVVPFLPPTCDTRRLTQVCLPLIEIPDGICKIFNFCLVRATRQ